MKKIINLFFLVNPIQVFQFLIHFLSFLNAKNKNKQILKKLKFFYKKKIYVWIYCFIKKKKN